MTASFTKMRNIRHISAPWGKKKLAKAKKHFHNELVRNKDLQEYPESDRECQAGFKRQKTFSMLVDHFSMSAKAYKQFWNGKDYHGEKQQLEMVFQ